MADDRRIGRPRPASRSRQIMVRQDGTVERRAAQPFGKQLGDAATHPFNLLALGALVASNLLLGFGFGVVLVVYAILVVASLVQASTKASKAGGYLATDAAAQLPPGLRERVTGVLQMVDRVQDDLLRMDAPPAGVDAGLDQLVGTLVETAQQAAEVDGYLEGIDRDELADRCEHARRAAQRNPAKQSIAEAFEEQLNVVDELGRRRGELDLQMEQISANLGVLHARIVQARIESDEVVQVDDELNVLRDRTRAMAQSLREVRELDTHQISPDA